MYTRDRGSVLAISLVLLTAITLIAIFSMERSGLQTKIVRNIQHAEMIFHSSMNEQEYWTSELRAPSSGDNLLSEPLLNFVLDVNNKEVYSPIPLSTMVEAINQVNVANNLVYVPNNDGEFALAEGQEVNERINYQLQLSSTAGMAGRNIQSSQTTGISFSGLNNNKNSIN